VFLFSLFFYPAVHYFKESDIPYLFRFEKLWERYSRPISNDFACAKKALIGTLYSMCFF